MTSPSVQNFGKFSFLCRSQTAGNEWMQNWPGEIDKEQIAVVLRPLALEFRQVDTLSNEEVLAVFFEERALALLSNLRNSYCFWVIAEEAGRSIGDYQYNISREAVLSAMEAKPEIRRAIVV